MCVIAWLWLGGGRVHGFQEHSIHPVNIPKVTPELGTTVGWWQEDRHNLLDGVDRGLGTTTWGASDGLDRMQTTIVDGGYISRGPYVAILLQVYVWCATTSASCAGVPIPWALCNELTRPTPSLDFNSPGRAATAAARTRNRQASWGLDLQFPNMATRVTNATLGSSEGLRTRVRGGVSSPLCFGLEWLRLCVVSLCLRLYGRGCGTVSVAVAVSVSLCLCLRLCGCASVWLVEAHTVFVTHRHTSPPYAATPPWWSCEGRRRLDARGGASGRSVQETGGTGALANSTFVFAHARIHARTHTRTRLLDHAP